MDKKLKIVVFPSDQWGCGHYRMLLPAKKLVERGHLVAVMWKYDDFPMDADIYHFQRITTPAGLKAMERLRSMNKLILMDMDDDLFHLYPGHPSSWYFGKGKQCMKCGDASQSTEASSCTKCGHTELEYQDRIKCCGDAFRYIDWLTISTPELEDKFGLYAPKTMRSKIIPNYVDIPEFEKNPDKGSDYLSVGWFGSFTHTRDLTELFGVLDVLLDYDDKHVFMTAGESPENILRLFGTSPELRERIINLQPVELPEYPGLLKNIDIGLAPIQDNHFNRCKSELKAIEYGAAKVPVIASNVAPYKRYVEHGSNGFIAKKHRDWVKYLRMLIEDEDLRREMGQANYEKALTMDINRRIVEREEFYLDIVEEHASKYPEVHTPVVPPKMSNPFGLGG